MSETAYRTADPEVIEAWDNYEAEYREVEAKRDALTEELGRKMWTRRSGFGGGHRIIGFERFDSDKDGDILHHGGCLIVSSRRGHHEGLIVPNLRRKAGKDFARELDSLMTPPLKLPGMPSFHLYSDDFGMRSASPALWKHDGSIYALWPCDSAPVKDNWETIPLSTYHLAHEQREEQADG